MKRELRTAWITALRSGKYKQTQVKLRDELGNGEYAYCCLGVLCDLLDPHGWDIVEHAAWADIDDAHEITKPHTLSFGDEHTLSIEALENIGLTVSQESTLVLMNDYGKSFDEIADWIETNTSVED